MSCVSAFAHSSLQSSEEGLFQEGLVPCLEDADTESDTQSVGGSAAGAGLCSHPDVPPSSRAHQQRSYPQSRKSSSPRFPRSQRICANTFLSSTEAPLCAGGIIGNPRCTEPSRDQSLQQRPNANFSEIRHCRECNASFKKPAQVNLISSCHKV